MSKIHDDYAYLSERSHPNSMCLGQYRGIEGPYGYLVAPPSHSTFGGINGYIIEWLKFMHTLLALAREDVVRARLVEILTAVTELPR